MAPVMLKVKTIHMELAPTLQVWVFEDCLGTWNHVKPGLSWPPRFPRCAEKGCYPALVGNHVAHIGPPFFFTSGEVGELFQILHILGKRAPKKPVCGHGGRHHWVVPSSAIASQSGDSWRSQSSSIFNIFQPFSTIFKVQPFSTIILPSFNLATSTCQETPGIPSPDSPVQRLKGFKESPAEEHGDS